MAEKPAGDHRNPVDRPEFGPLLGGMREARGISKAELARRTGVDPSHVSRLEGSGRGVSRELVDRIAKALDTSPRETNALLSAAGFLTEEAAELLAQPELSRLAALLAGDDLRPAHRDLILRQLRLALDQAEALGYRTGEPTNV